MTDQEDKEFLKYLIEKCVRPPELEIAFKPLVPKNNIFELTDLGEYLIKNFVITHKGR